MGRLEQKDIRYRGYSTLPDDYQVADGAIAFATNAVYEDGGLKVLQEAKPLQLLVAGGAKIYIHHTVNYYHYIIVYEFKDEEENKYVRLYVVDRDIMEKALAGEEPFKTPYDYIDAIYHIGSEGDLPDNMSEGVVDFLYRCEGAFVSLVAVANTLVVSTEEEMYYFLCKPGGITDDDGQTALTEYCTHPYIFLGNKVPSVEIEFGLSEQLVETTYSNTGLEKTNSAEPGEEDITATTVWNALSFIGVTASEGNKYYFPNADKLTLRKDNAYRLRLEEYSVHTPLVYIWASAVDTGEEEMLCELNENNFDAMVYYRKTFAVSKDYTNPYITVKRKDSQTTGAHSVQVWLDTSASYYLGDTIYYIKYSEDSYEAVMSCLNKFVASHATDRNRFIHPFFVRYAVRLYDASVCELSVPILMLPNSGYAPFIYTQNDYDSRNNEYLQYFAFVADLLCKNNHKIDVNWDDIIQGVDIYISAPIYPYDSGENYDSAYLKFAYKDYITKEGEEKDELTGLNLGYGSLMNGQEDFLNENIAANDLFVYMQSEFSFGKSNTDYYRLTQIAPKTRDELIEELTNVSNFYFVKRYNLEDLNAIEIFENINFEKGVLSGLVSRETLSEDVVSYDSFAGAGLYSYNQRMHTYGGLLRYRDSMVLPRQCQYVDAYSKDAEGNYYTSLYRFTEAWVYIKTNEGTKVIYSTYDGSGCYYGGNVWFFYPNNRAYKVVIAFQQEDSEETSYISLELHEHEFLNGAYFYYPTNFGLWEEDLAQYISSERPEGYDEEIASTSIYVSEVNNPFVFRNSSAVTVGSGKILALSSAAQAMSQGQFGQYPLYAFTDEGIWALSVQTDGTYGTSQPIARDVVTNVDSITQLDSSVLFVTDRGIMEIAGSKVACISEGIDGEWGEFNPLELPYFAELYLKYVEGVVEGDEDYEAKKVAFEAMVNAWAEERFFNFIKTCRMVYDYVHQRILVYNSEMAIGYNFSLESKEWSLMFSELRYSVNSYPEALALEKVDDSVYGLPSDEEHWGLVNVSESVDEGDEGDDVQTELFVTRPFKLDAPDVYKTVESVVQRGYFQQSAQENHIVGSVLYGSTDLFNWYIVGQSASVEVVEGSGQYTPGHIIDKMQGSPYKYFRVAVLCRLKRRETICGCSMLYELKDNNMLR